MIMILWGSLGGNNIYFEFFVPESCRHKQWCMFVCSGVVSLFLGHGCPDGTDLYEQSQVFLRTEPFTPKKKPKKEVDYFWKHQTSNRKKMTHYGFSSVPCTEVGKAAVEREKQKRQTNDIEVASS
jgi:hypothetical protein